MIASACMKDRCACGQEKEVKNRVCMDCWNLAPQPLREELIATTDRAARRDIYARIIAAIDAVRAEANPAPENVFLALVRAECASQSRDLAAPQSLAETCDSLTELIEDLRHVASTPKGQLLLLVEMAVHAMRAADALVIGGLSAATLRGLLEEYGTEGEAS